jgi:hypothetical protein
VGDSRLRGEGEYVVGLGGDVDSLAGEERGKDVLLGGGRVSERRLVGEVVGRGLGERATDAGESKELELATGFTGLPAREFCEDCPERTDGVRESPDLEFVL